MPSFGFGGYEPGLYIFIGDEQLRYKGELITLTQKHVVELLQALAFELSGERDLDIQVILDRVRPKPLPSDEVLNEEMKNLTDE